MKHLSDEEINSIVKAIQTAEENSTGEIRVHIDSSIDEKTEKDDAKKSFDIFHKLGMQNTKDRNAVLFHINFNQRYLTIIGDEGIHQKVCQSFWDEIYEEMIQKFTQEKYFQAIEEAILKTGVELKKYFPINNGDNPNELPNEVTFS